mmetsp:Transcript_26547/g.71712  ORF Transcript_26547/g.71712 Transcript_26547/m.71712 type:complete len:231 (-) Transcript_26547:382-1074(-)|eukprot:CAMPEP_0185192156 /NCGR_PEP_ID=MMETSP1140-20130426/17778_1 /TAXON_ID=298111 /ORGANISM="Pavlova sp., Strain CCMP459" /LENGTH=230 /DNA_ID=CAMNT_0027758887 /DNA_START=18 /DNA_END=710 /DNA_ORIENTATION=-
MVFAAAVLSALAFSGPVSPVRVRTSAFTCARPASASAVYMDAEKLKGIQKDVEERMTKTMQSLDISLQTIRTGRANPSMLDRVTVDYYGAPTALNQLASISVPTAQTLVVEPYDKAALKDVEKALSEADLGMSPNNDGQVLRLNVPPLTEERRKEFAKQAKAFGEDAKVALRNIRRDAMDSVKKMEKSDDSPIGKDESADAQDKVDGSAKKFTKQVDERVSDKEKEIMKV